MDTQWTIGAIILFFAAALFIGLITMAIQDNRIQSHKDFSCQTICQNFQWQRTGNLCLCQTQPNHWDVTTMPEDK